MKNSAPFCKERLELSILDKRNHEYQEPNIKQKQPGKGIGGPDKELVMWGRPHQLRGSFITMCEGVDFLHLEHHE